MRREQFRGLKPPGQGPLTRNCGDQAVRQGRDCQRQGGRGIGLMVWPTHVNRRELIVKQSKPKALIGFNQKVRDREQERRDDCRRLYGRR